MTVQLIGTSKIVKYLQEISLKEEFTYGLVIGQSSKELNRHYAVHTALTKPEPPADGDVDHENKNQANCINEKLVLDHFISVYGMVPGGINVFGIFIIQNTSDYNASIRKSISTVYDTLNDKRNFDGNFLEQFIFDTVIAKQSDFFILNYCTLNNEICVKSIRNGKKDNLVDTQWKIDDNLKWIEVDTNINFENYFGCPIIDKSTSPTFKAEQAFETTLRDIKSTLTSSKIKFSRNIWEKSKHDESENGENIKSSIFFQPIKDLDAKLRYNITYLGAVTSKVSVTADSSQTFVKQCIIEDLVRSISRRFDFFTNSLNCTETADMETNSQVLDLPRRIFIEVPDMNMKFSDLLFHTDDIEDILIEQADQLLDSKLTRDHFMTNEYKDLVVLTTKDPLSDSHVINTKILYLVASVFVFFAILIAFILQQKQN